MVSVYGRVSREPLSLRTAMNVLPAPTLTSTLADNGAGFAGSYVDGNGFTA